MALRTTHNPSGSEDDRLPIDWTAALARHDRWLRTVVRSRVGDCHAVDDVMQEVALAVTRQPPPLEDPARAAPWLYRVALRQSLLFRRRVGRRRRLADRYADRLGSPGQSESSQDPLEWILGNERRESVRKAMAQLAPRDSEILTLKHTEGWTYQQLADHLGISVNAVEYRLLRARDRLRSQLLARQVSEV
jgi:RNA polymerase sigma-70 factor (ECF subfamily)